MSADGTLARSAKQAALFRISQLSQNAGNLESLYASVHEVVGELMSAKNFYIATHDPETDRLDFPYFVDERDPEPPWVSAGRGLTAYVLRTGQPL